MFSWPSFLRWPCTLVCQWELWFPPVVTAPFTPTQAFLLHKEPLFLCCFLSPGHSATSGLSVVLKSSMRVSTSPRTMCALAGKRLWHFTHHTLPEHSLTKYALNVKRLDAIASVLIQTQERNKNPCNRQWVSNFLDGKIIKGDRNVYKCGANHVWVERNSASFT